MEITSSWRPTQRLHTKQLWRKAPPLFGEAPNVMRSEERFWEIAT